MGHNRIEIWLRGVFEEIGKENYILLMLCSYIAQENIELFYRARMVTEQFSHMQITIQTIQLMMNIEKRNLINISNR
jgi:hypothetical protein